MRIDKLRALSLYMIYVNFTYLGIQKKALNPSPKQTLSQNSLGSSVAEAQLTKCFLRPSYVK